ncbi:MAG: membrane protein insertase YidC [Puniceicoccales bacterium]|jgi:YidC/Oxa1 family membrane protein insertase|nr:membrane protein insertase YidC [Puniceicoccales bacterium]
MDKKNTTIGILLLAAAIALFVWDANRRAKIAEQYPQSQPPPTVVAPVPVAPIHAPGLAPAPSSPGLAPVARSTPAAPVEGKIVSLENDTLRLNLNTHGGAIRNIALLKHADVLKHRKDPAEHPYLFNGDGAVPALSFSTDGAGGVPVEWAPSFSVVKSEPGHSIALAATQDGLAITRIYTLAAKENDPHVVNVRTTFRAVGPAPVAAFTLRLNMGALPPTKGDVAHQFLGIASYDGTSFSKTSLSDLSEKAFIRVPRGVQPWQWVSVTNQYFAGILRFDESTSARATDLHVSPLYRAAAPGQAAATGAYTLTGDVGFYIPALQPGQEVTLGADYFVGPREYTRLANLGGGQEKAVQFAKLYFISVDFLCKVFVVTLAGLHSILPDVVWAWGLAIILLTVIIKALTWPLITAQQRSAERMRQFQGPMKAIREKYKDDPKRQQQETMKLYQEHKINPFAGCLPVLIQIPVFTGLYFTFQSLSQLRFQSFLWIADLSIPDVLPGLEDVTIFGIPIHILPILVAVTMLINMRLMPMPNVEGQQKLIFYGMMIIFPVFCYGMPAALMLYYSVQNVLTIFQTLITRRRFQREAALVSTDGGKVTVLLPDSPSGGKKKKDKRKS